MLLTIDIGNTGILIGAFSGDALSAHWRLSASSERTVDEYGLTLRGLLGEMALQEGGGKETGKEGLRGDIGGVIISCVVPELTGTFTSAVEGYLSIKPLIVGPGVKTGMPILTDDPREVGPDRIVNAVGAYGEYGGPLVIVDFGTAVTLDYVTEKGEYAGGAIAPGIGISKDALTSRAARLPRVDIKRPERVVGKNTVECIRSGLYHGFGGLVDSIVGKIKKETGASKAKVIATGGQAHPVYGACTTIDAFDEFLVLKGLKKIHEVNT